MTERYWMLAPQTGHSSTAHSPSACDHIPRRGGRFVHGMFGQGRDSSAGRQRLLDQMKTAERAPMKTMTDVSIKESAPPHRLVHGGGGANEARGDASKGLNYAKGTSHGEATAATVREYEELSTVPHATPESATPHRVDLRAAGGGT